MNVVVKRIIIANHTGCYDYYPVGFLAKSRVFS